MFAALSLPPLLKEREEHVRTMSGTAGKDSLDTAFRTLAANFYTANPHADLSRLLPCLETEVQSRVILMNIDNDSILKLCHLPLRINANNAVYRDNIRLLTVQS